MLITQDLIWFASDASYTRLDLYSSGYLPRLTLDCQCLLILIWTLDFFDRFLLSWSFFWRFCSSQTFWFWFSCFRQSHIWNNMQMPCNVSFMYDHAWMKCLCIKSIFSFFLLSDLPHFLSACTSQVDFSDLLYFFHLLSQVNISTLMLSRHVIFLSLEVNIIDSLIIGNTRSPFLLFHHFCVGL